MKPRPFHADKLRFERERFVIVGKRFTMSIERLEDVASFEQGFGHIGLEGQCAIASGKRLAVVRELP